MYFYVTVFHVSAATISWSRIVRQAKLRKDPLQRSLGLHMNI